MARFNFTTMSKGLIRGPTLRIFSTAPALNDKARVAQILSQAQSATSSMYETVKQKALDDNVDRRNQLIWLVKHSLGKEEGRKEVSLHELPWDASEELKGDGKDKVVGDVDVRVWGGLW